MARQVYRDEINGALATKALALAYALFVTPPDILV